MNQRPEHRGLALLIPWGLAILIGVGSPIDAEAAERIPVGSLPFFAGANPVTNRVYASNQWDASVSVIDGTTHAIVATIPVGQYPGLEDVVANPITNHVYVASFGAYGEHTVAVIDGATDTVITMVPLAEPPFRLAVNPVTNRVYIRQENSVSVLDGTTNTVVATIPVEGGPFAIAVNPSTNRIYVGSYVPDVGGYVRAVKVIDGSSHTIIGTIRVGEVDWLVDGPHDMDVNPANNRLYVAMGSVGLVVIDEASLAVVATVTVGGPAYAVAVNPTNQRVYVRTQPQWARGLLTVVDATTNTVMDAYLVEDRDASTVDVAVNSATNRVYVPIASADVLWATDDPPAVGGTRFGLSPRTEGVLLTWSGGAIETGYSIARWAADSGTVEMLPRNGPLPSGTTSYTDAEPLTESAYFYAVLPRDASGVLWMSHLLGLQPNTGGTEGTPQDFTIRHVESEEGLGLMLTWRAPGGVSNYDWVSMDAFDNTDHFLPGDHPSMAFVDNEPRCHMIFAVGAVAGNTHSLCSLPLWAGSGP